MGKGSKQTIGHRYYLGAQAVLCFGAIDAIKQLRVREQTAFQGTAEGGTTLSVNRPNLLGGDDSEGGFIATIDVEDGNSAQVQNTYLQRIYDGATAAFRGVSQLVFRGGDTSGAYWGNNPSLGPFDVAVQRIDKSGYNGATQWYPGKAKIAGDYLPGADVGEPEYTPAYPGAVGELLPATAPPNEGIWAATGGDEDIILVKDPANVDASLTSTGFLDDYYLRVQGGSLSNTYSAVFYIDLEALAGDDYDIEARLTCEMGRSAEGGIRIHGAEASIFTTSTVSGVSNPSGGTTEATVSIPVSGAGGTDWTAKDTGWVTITGGQKAVAVVVKGTRGHVFRNIRLILRGDFSNRVYDMNPAHIVRELLTDQHFGRRVPSAQIDGDSFEAAANTLFDESFGLSIKHNAAQDSPDDLISKVERTCDLRVYTNRSTGLYQIKLIRDDYDINTIPHFTADNVVDVRQCDVKREVAADLPNTVTVPYWDWAIHDTTSIWDDNAAKVADDGGADNTEADVIGITNATLAAKVLDRELTATTVPKLLGTLYFDRNASDLHPGDAFRVTDSRLGLSGEVLRVLDVDEGNGIDSRVRIQFVQDKFTLGQVIQVPEDRVPDSVVVDPADATGRLVEEAPYYLLARAIGDAGAQDELANDPTLGYLLAGAVSPGGTHLRANVMVDEGSGYERQDLVDFMEGPTLTADVSALPTETTLTISSDAGLDLISTPSMIWVDDEIMVVTNISGTTLTVGRGCLDTIPAAHSSGANVYFFQDYAEIVEEQYNDGETIDVKFQTVTGTGVLDLADATATALEFASRANRPYPAANLQLEGSYAPTTLDDGDVLTWKHRDRLTQTTETIYDWTDDNIGPEPGVSYRIDAFAIDALGNEAATAYWSDTTASNSYTLDAVDYATGAPADARSARFVVTAYRGSPAYDAWQNPSFVLPILTVRAGEDGTVFTDEAGNTRAME